MSSTVLTAKEWAWVARQVLGEDTRLREALDGAADPRRPHRVVTVEFTAQQWATVAPLVDCLWSRPELVAAVG